MRLAPCKISCYDDFFSICTRNLCAFSQYGGRYFGGPSCAEWPHRRRAGPTLCPGAASNAAAHWRQVFRQFGVNPTKTRSAPEALLRRLTKAGAIPNINTLVDIGNLISIRYAMPVAVCDTRHVQGPITVHLADGSERYTELGSSELLHPEPGEVVFTDETGLVVARRWCWRQSAESAAQVDTTQVIIAIEAQHADGRAHVDAAVTEMLALLNEFAGGEFETKILDKTDGKC